MVNIDEELFEYVRYDMIDAAIECLDKGGDVNYEDECDSLIYTAVCNDSLQMVKMLLERGADINEEGGYLLYVAYECDFDDMIKLLLSEGIKYDSSHGSLIGWCICHDDVDSLKLLIEFDIGKPTSGKSITFEGEQLSIWKMCLRSKATKVLEFIINNYHHVIPNKLSVKKKDIKKYNFIKMLMNRNLVDVAD
jgi:ankyrin repeat protein